MGLAQKTRQHGDRQQQQQPRTENEKRRAEREKRQRVLTHRKQLRQQYEPARRLPPGALQTVVEIRVLKLV